jgi:hypothetical protein
MLRQCNAWMLYMHAQRSTLVVENHAETLNKSHVCLGSHREATPQEAHPEVRLEAV